MAFTRSKQVLSSSTNGDTVGTDVIVQAMSCDDAVTVKDASGNTIWNPGSASNIQFPCGLYMDDLEKDAGAGTLYVYLK